MNYKFLRRIKWTRGGQDGNHHATEDTPPDYSALPPSNQSSKAVPQATAPVLPEAAEMSHPEETGGGQGRSRIYSKHFHNKDDEGWDTLGLMMVPDPGAPSYKTAPWVAILEITTTDMPRLMREGFFWSVENIVPEEGFMSSGTEPGWTPFESSNHQRTWVLADKSNDEAPRWVGVLEVVTPSSEILPSFRAQNLTRENVCAAVACNGLGFPIYEYNYWTPRKNFNCIYDDKPLQGWWPWPREEGAFAALIAPAVGTVGESSSRSADTSHQPCQPHELHASHGSQESHKPDQLQHSYQPRVSSTCAIM